MLHDHYDYIICGAGLSGLSLAERLAADEFSNKKILIIDKSSKKVKDRTWSFWTTKENNRYASIYRKSWKRLAFYAPDVEVISGDMDYQYNTVDGLDFYNHTLSIINKSDHITFLQASVNEILDEGARVVVKTEEQAFTSDYVFDSIVRSFPDGEELFMWQHFMGWEVELEEGSFDEDTMTFMDFRIDQDSDTRFVYVLPFDKKTALVEATLFSKELWAEEAYEQMLAAYMEKYIKLPYKIKEKEIGKIPMTTAPFSVGSKRVIPIGTNNATVKPSSGYAFTRIQREVDILIDRIRQNKIKRVKGSKRFLSYDRTLLNVVLTGKQEALKVFSLMFQRNEFGANLKFLDEQTSLIEEAKIFLTLPTWPFFKAFVQENVFRFTKR